MTNKPKIVYMPGAFDDFEGTQEELDALVAEIESLTLDDYSNFQEAHVMSLEELFEINPELAVSTGIEMGIFDDVTDKDGNKVSAEDILTAIKDVPAFASIPPSDKKKLH
jgi:hypothetical protein